MDRARRGRALLALALWITAGAAVAGAQTRAEPLVWGPPGRHGQFAPLSGSWAALGALDSALNAPADGATVFVSGGGAALRVAVSSAGSGGTLIEITDSATYDWLEFNNKSRIYIRARAGQTPRVVSDSAPPDPASGGNSNAIVFSGANSDIGIQGLTFLVRAYGNAETVRRPSKVGAIRYSTLAGGTRLQGLLIQDCRFEPLDRALGAVVAIQLANETGSTSLHRDIGIRRSVFDSTGTVEAASDDLAAISVADFENVLVANVHFKRTSTQPAASQMRGVRANVRNGLIEYAYCEDIGNVGGANECAYVSHRTGDGLGSLDGLDVTVRNTAALSANRAFAVTRANSTMSVDHAVVVTGSAEQVLQVGEATSSLSVSNSIFVQLSGNAMLLHNPLAGPFTTHHNLYRWIGPRPFTPDATDKYPGSMNCNANCDPLFINPLGSDFRMAAGSPALKAASDGGDMGLLLFSISPATRSFGTSGGTGAVTVTASGPWTGAPTVGWITPASYGPVGGDGTANYLVASNNSSTTRTGTLVLAGISHTVTQAGIACNLTISPPTQSPPAGGASGAFTISQAASDCAWSAASDVGWMAVTGGSTGSGLSGSVAYAVGANASSGTRVGTISVSGGSVTKTFTVTQAGVGCNYTLDRYTTTLPPTAVTGQTVQLTAAVGDCAWSAASNAGWLQITAGAGGLGSGTVTFRADANPNSAARSGTLTIAGQTFTVQQQGVTCTQQVSETAAFIGAAGGAGNPVSVTSSAPDCSWTANVSGTSPWIALTSGNVRTGSGPVTWRADPNSSSLMRTGTITIAGTPVTVNQAGAACAFTLTGNGTPAPIHSGGGAGSIGVDATAVDCPWSAASQADWITLTGPTSLTGDGAVNFSVAPNASSLPRLGTILVAGQSYTVTQNGLSCAYAISPTLAMVGVEGGTGIVDLTAAVGDCTWSATPAAGVDWISVTSPNPVVGSGTATYAVAANPLSTERVGLLQVAGLGLTVRQPGVACTYTLSAPGASAGSAATSGTVTVTTSAADCAWTIVAGEAWVTTSGPAQRVGSAAVNFSIAANPSSLARDTTLSIAGRGFAVHQNGVLCTYALTPASASATVAGGTQTVKVTTPASDCAWTNTSSHDWLAITSGAQRQGTQNITLSIASNAASSKPRTGTVTIAGGSTTSTYTVTQAATACTIVVPASVAATVGGGTAGIDLALTPADCDWTATTDVPWLTLAPDQQAGSGSRRLEVTVAPTTSSKARTGNVTIGSKKVAVTQPGITCAYTLSSPTANFDYKAATGVVELTSSAVDCQWGTTKSAAWVTLGVTSGTGSRLVPYTVAANATTLPRQASVMVGGVEHLITQGPAPCGISLASSGGNVTAGATTGSFSVTAVSVECSWFVSSTAPWITITQPAPVTPDSPLPLSGQGSGAVKFSVAANTSSKPRAGVINVGDRAYTVTQAGAACTYTLVPTSVAVPPVGASGTIGVTASVTDCEWTASTTVPWVALGSRSGTGNGGLSYSVGSNTGTRSRTTSITVGGKSVAINQSAQGVGGSLFTRYLAEGATGRLFSTRFALLNPGTSTAATTMRFLTHDGRVVEHKLSIKPSSRVTVEAQPLVGDAEFSTEVTSTAPLVVDRTMTWDVTGYGSHAETAVQYPAETWYLAEGSTAGDFDLFYLIQNPNPEPAAVEVIFLLPGGMTPVKKTYRVPADSRYSVWVDLIPEVSDTDVSGVVTADRPIIVERAMYISRPWAMFAGGHESMGVTAPSTEWYLAEGSTGPYFDTYLLVANPSTTAADVLVTYLLPGGGALEKSFPVGAQSRFTIWVDQEDPLLADTSVSAIVRATNGVPIIVERAMWWPGNWTTWHEAHNSAGVTETGTKWALAEGEVGGSRNTETYVLVANTAGRAGQAKLTLLFESGAPVSRTVDLPPNSRTNVDIGKTFPEARGKRFGTIVESLGTSPAPIVVERAMYSDAGGVHWAAGTNAVATRLP